MLPKPTTAVQAPQAPALSPQAVERTSRLIRQQRGRADALIEVLHQVQELYGYLPPGALAQVARELKLPLARVFGVASFYHLFRLEAPTAHRCAVPTPPRSPIVSTRYATGSPRCRRCRGCGCAG